MRRHDLDLFSLVAGVLFLVIAVGHLADVAWDVGWDGRWVAPVVLVGLGLAGLAGVVRGRGDDRVASAPDDHDRALDG